MADLRTTKPDEASSKSIVLPAPRERFRPAGPSGPRRPAPPSLLERRTPRKTRTRNVSREGGGVSHSMRDAQCEPRAHLSPRPAKRGESAEDRRSEAGEGTRALSRCRSPIASARAPSPASGRGEESAGRGLRGQLPPPSALYTAAVRLKP